MQTSDCHCRSIGANPMVCPNGIQCDQPPALASPVSIVPPKPLLELDSDEPLVSGACPLDGSCESCQ